MIDPVTEHGKFIRRTLHLAKMNIDGIKFELEFNDRLTDGRRKKLKLYLKHLEFVYRDVITSTPSNEGYELVYDELNSERHKDISELLDWALKCDNIGEITETLKGLPTVQL